MKRLLLLLCYLYVYLAAGSLPAQIKPGRGSPRPAPQRFFGLHFDFHANGSHTRIGETLTAAMIDSLLTLVQPDYVQVDCKGHPGLSSYPTKAGSPAGGFTQDPLKLWREVTRKHGVALYVHYSGVIDQEAIRKHPEWAAINAKGVKDKRSTSLHSAYADQLLIPQLKEISKDYQVDGAWVDGECWGVIPDYSEAALANFRRETGIGTVPRSPADPHYRDFLEFHRKSYRKYLGHYVDALHAFNPNFKITGNWAYSSHMPERVDVDVDFLSGDLKPANSVNSAAFEARCLAHQGKPWDLMAWSFTRDWSKPETSTKSAVQLCQEAAQVLAMGGGFQAYFKQNKDASIQPWTMGLMKELAGFCRARQPFCHGAVPVRQIAVLFPSESYKRVTPHVYRPWSGELAPMEGILTALLDGQHTVDILMDHHVKGRLHEYPLVVIPEWNYLPADLREELLQYASGGGKVLAIGAQTVPLFEKELGVVLEGDTATRNLALGYHHQIAGMRSLFRAARLGEKARAFGGTYTVQDLRFPGQPAASVAPYGKGKIAGVYFNVGRAYTDSKNTVTRNFLSGLVRELFADPLVEVTGSHLVHVAVNQLGEKLAVNLINVAGEHANKHVFSYDEVPPLGPLQIRIHATKAPTRVTLQPEGETLAYTFSNNTISVAVPRLAIHSILVVEP